MQIIAEIVAGELATKQDIENPRNELILLERRLIIKVGAIVTAVVAAAVTVLKLTYDA